MHIGYVALLIATNANEELGCRYLNSVYNIRFELRFLCILLYLL